MPILVTILPGGLCSLLNSVPGTGSLVLPTVLPTGLSIFLPPPGPDGCSLILGVADWLELSEMHSGKFLEQMGIVLDDFKVSKCLKWIPHAHLEKPPFVLLSQELWTLTTLF